MKFTRLAAVAFAATTMLVIPALAQAPAQMSPFDAAANQALSQKSPVVTPAASPFAAPAEKRAAEAIKPVLPATADAVKPTVVVPPVGAAEPKPGTAVQPPRTQAALVDINSATTKEMVDALTGIGSARADAIIGGRPYRAKDELVSKGVLTQAVFDGMKDQIALAEVNTASAADLVATLPGIGKARAEAIVKGRPYKTLEDLVAKGVLTQSVYDGVKGLITLRAAK